jgi:hypothetical protein
MSPKNRKDRKDRVIGSQERLAGWLHARLAERVMSASPDGWPWSYHPSGSSTASYSSSLASAIDLLGRGKDGTLVYPATQIPSRFAPDACVVVAVDKRKSEDGPGPKRRRSSPILLGGVGDDRRCIAAADEIALRRAGLGDDVAIKDVREESAAKAEAAIHAHLRQCFKRARRMRACCLHHTVLSVSVDDHVLIPMRVGFPIENGVDGRGWMLRPGGLGVRDLLGLARGVLGGLAVMHDNRVLHLDVKPQNIMTVGRKGAASGRRSTSSSLEIVLVDYDLTAHFEDVLDAMRDGPVAVGTPGYISPILLGRMEPAFVRCCALASSADVRRACARHRVHMPALADDVAWVEHFALVRHRVLSSSSAALELLPQIDMHSLAVSLYRLSADRLGRMTSSSSTKKTKAAEGDDRDRTLLLALIGGLLGGGLEGASDALKLVRHFDRRTDGVVSFLDGVSFPVVAKHPEKKRWV